MSSEKKQTKIWPFYFLIIMITAFIFLKINQSGEKNNEEPIIAPTYQNIEMEQNLVSDYLKSHISELSPEKEVLGGTFYVTKIKFQEEKNFLIEYEDGHIQLLAKGNYILSHDEVLEIKDFEVLISNGQLKPKQQFNLDDLMFADLQKKLTKKYPEETEIKLEVDGQDNNFWRGRADFLDKRLTWLAIMKDNNLQLIYDGGLNFPCQQLRENGFSQNILPECWID